MKTTARSDRRSRMWLVALASGGIHGAFWFYVAREMRLQTAILEGPAALGSAAFLLGGLSIVAFYGARPLGRWDYLGGGVALVAGLVVGVFSEEMLGLQVDNVLIPPVAGLLVAGSAAAYLMWMVSNPRWSLRILIFILGFGGGTLTGIKLAEPVPTHPPHVPPDFGVVEFPEWKMGDVHVHAAGDRDLVNHPDCRGENGYLEGADCARQLVQITADAANNSGAKWVILVEHGAWLAGGADYDEDKGVREWNQLRAAAEALSPASGVRMLMGEELGTSGVSFAGHFSAYSTPRYVPNSARRIPDVRYIEAVAETGGWGAINHPFQGGNEWECWYPTRQCGVGAAGFAAPARDAPATFRAIEISNGGRFPTDDTLARWDQLLVQGYRVWAVGGSDAHSRSRDWRDVLHGGSGVPNLGKIGTSRTFAYVPEDVTPPENYDATDPDDPVRQAIYSGAVVASNGPRALAVVGEAGPGQTEPIPPGHVTIQLGIKWPTQFTQDHVDPTQVRVTYSQVSRSCAEQCPRPLVIVRDVPPVTDAMTVPLAVPEEWEQAYVRVEVSTGGNAPVGAFINPIFIARAGS